MVRCSFVELRSCTAAPSTSAQTAHSRKSIPIWKANLMQKAMDNEAMAMAMGIEVSIKIGYERNIGDWVSSESMDNTKSTISASDSHDHVLPKPMFIPPRSFSGSSEDGGDLKGVDNDGGGGLPISVSTTFLPGVDADSLPTDLTILSSDSVFFSVNSERLLAASNNAFNSHLRVRVKRESESDSDPTIPILNLPETSPVLNIVLHSMHDMSCSHYCPSLPDITAAVSALLQYGVPVSKALAPSAPLYTTLLAHAPTQPIDVYALAAKYDLYELGAATSSHLLSLQLQTLTDEMAGRIGAKYLKKLFFLHLGRCDALKRLILAPPQLHAQTPQCDFNDQKQLTSAWMLAASYVTWDGRPDISASAIEATIRPLMEHLTCETCKAAMNERIREVVVQWSLVKRTI